MTKFWFSVTVSMLLAQSTAPPSLVAADGVPQVPKKTSDIPDSGLAEVTDLTDFDHITMRVGSQRVVVALARVLPLSAWPTKNAPEGASELRREAIDAPRAQLVNKKDVFYSIYRTGGPNHPPFVKLTRRTVEFDPKKPSGRAVWFMVEYDLWLIESGFSPPVRLAPMLASRDFAWVDKLYGDAEYLAKNGKLGIWRFPTFADAIADVARRDSDPPPLALRELDDAALLKIGERLLGSGDGDNDICVAFSSGLREIATSLKPATRSALSDQLIRAFRAHSSIPVRRDLMGAITDLGDESSSTLLFLESVAADESDKDLKQIARDAASRIRPTR